MRYRFLAGTLAVAAIVTPAAANYFSNPVNNTTLNIGSAPSPTPDDLRQIGDGRYQYLGFTLRSLVGKPVYTRDLQYVGPVRSVDEPARTALVQLDGGVAVPIAAKDVRDTGDRVIVPMMSKQNFRNLARTKGVITGPSTDRN
jgi:hypothetical protein